MPTCIAGGIPACLAAGGACSGAEGGLGGGVRGIPAPGRVPAQGGLHIPPRKQTATVADGTHPTGMHSCLLFFLHNSIQINS